MGHVGVGRLSSEGLFATLHFPGEKAARKILGLDPVGHRGNFFLWDFVENFHVVAKLHLIPPTLARRYLGGLVQLFVDDSIRV